MNILRNIEKSILGHIEDHNKYNLDITKNMIKTFFENKKGLDEINEKKYNNYMALFENERIKNSIEYDIYVKERNGLKTIWDKTKSKAALLDMLKFPKPTMKQIPEVYSYGILEIRDKRLPIIPIAIKDINPKKITMVNKPKEPKVAKVAKEPKVPK